MHRTTMAAAAAAALCLAAGAASAQDKWGAHLDFEAKPGTKRSLGEGDLFVPLWQDGRSLLFGNFRGRFDNDSGREGNFGLGLRRMLESGWNLGGYGYFDRRKTENDNYFNQATLGAEALGRDWDLRANAYLPSGDRVKEAGTANTASISGTTVLVSSVTTDERALKGFDAEVGWRVPLFEAEATKQLRVYAGGYRFKDDVAKVEGPRVRAEFAMAELNGLWSGAQLMVSAEAQDDDRRGSQSFVGLRLRIPLGGKAERPRLGWQERRMTAPVVRDVDIVAPAVARAPVVETAMATANGQPITILDSGTTNGPGLQGALSTAGPNSTVVLTGTYTTSGSTTLQNGQTLMGAGTIQVRTPSGTTATLRTPGATINADIPGSGPDATVVMASNSTLTGMTVTHFNTSGGSATAVRAAGSNVLITGNTVSASASGSPAPVAAQGILVFSGSTNVVVSNNVVAAIGTNVQNIVGINAGLGGFGTVTLSGNTITISGSGSSAASVKYGIGISGGVPGGTIATITGNTISVTGPVTSNTFVLNAVNAAVAAGSTGNVRTGGNCNFGPGTSGSLGFADGTTCP